MANSVTRVKRSKRFFVIALVLLMITHIAMGVVLVTTSKKALREQIEQRMLDIANTAAYQLNGDEMAKLTANDVGTESYNNALYILRSFQNNIHLDYIYAIRAEQDGTFTFMIDPDANSPGQFGSPIPTTDAVKKAANGTPAVDREPYEDKWGRFYSAFSPVMDSKGNVAAIVAVDFNADWYEKILSSHKGIVIILSMIVLTLGIVLSFTLHVFIIEGEKKEYKKQLEETIEREREQKQELGSTRQLAYTDPLTGVKNKLSYLEAVERVDNAIANGTMKQFGVAVFDLNGLKNINDSLGHDVGDNYIRAGCNLICIKFCHSPVFRIGGDEFAVLLEGTDYKYREALLSELDSQVEENLGKGLVVVSSGMSIFEPGVDKDYASVFERADRKMYERKRMLKKQTRKNMIK